MRRTQAKGGKGSTTEGTLSFEEAASALRVSRSTLTRWIGEGRVKGFKMGRRWRFSRAELEKFSHMAHPSAGDVKLGELAPVVAALERHRAGAPEVELPAVATGYPATAEEEALVTLLRSMIAPAIAARASDIHLDAYRQDTPVRFRLDGVLHQVAAVPRSAHRAIVACIKYHADMAPDQEQVPQDGRFRVTAGGIEYDLRVATMPSVFGESVVMRLLPRTDELLSLDDPRLAMNEADLARYTRALRQPCGLLVVAGPTGSGKTTLLYAGLRCVANPELKILTVEDPVECAFPWVTQTAVNVKAGLTYEAAVRAMMRHDPDVIMVGNLRTPAAAEAAAQAAVTGHLVLSQLHAANAARAVVRLLDLGVEPFVLSESLICVVSLRLARRVCSECAQPDHPAFDLLSPLAERARAGGYQLPDDPQFTIGAGCDRCRGTGYHRRMGIYEVMEVNEEIQRLIASRDHASAEQIQQAAVRNGMTTLAADALRKAAEGITSVAEAARVTHTAEV